jgi:hypothetical protein
VGGQRYAPAILSPGKTHYPLCRRLGGPHSRSGRVRKISPPPGFDLRTVQPVTRRYTDCSAPEKWRIVGNIIITSRRKPTRSGPSDWGLSEKLKTAQRKHVICYEKE